MEPLRPEDPPSTGPSRPPAETAGRDLPSLTLAEVLASQGPLDETATLRLARDLAAALVRVHGDGALHLGVKPSDIVLDEDGARLVEPTQAPGGEAAAGTSAYLAPEQITGAALTPAADVFALGTTLLTAATGINPFATENAFQTMRNVVESEPDLSGLPEGLRGIIRQSLRKDPAERLTPARILQLLDLIQGEEDVTTPLPPAVSGPVPLQDNWATGFTPPPPKLGRTGLLSPRSAVAAFAVLALLVVTGFAFAAFGGDGDTEPGVIESPAEPRVYEERPFEALTTVGELLPYPNVERANGQELEIYNGVGYYYYRSNPNNQVPGKTYTGAMDMRTGQLLWEKIEEATPEGRPWDARWVFGEDLLALWVQEGDFTSAWHFLDPASGEQLTSVPAGTTEQLEDATSTYEAPGWHVVSGRLLWVNPTEPDTLSVYDASGQVEQTLVLDDPIVEFGVFADWDAYLAEPEGDISDGRIWAVTEDGTVTALDVATGESETFAEVEGAAAYGTLFFGYQDRFIVAGDDPEGYRLTVYEEGGDEVATAVVDVWGSLDGVSICGEFRLCVIDPGTQGLNTFRVFDLEAGEFVFDAGDDLFLVDYVRGVGDSIIAGVIDAEGNGRTLLYDEQFQLVETMNGDFYPIDAATALQTPSSTYGQIESTSGSVSGLAAQSGTTTVLDAEMEVGGLCDFDAETMICFLMEGLQAYRFRSA